jgi:hypothetical protein
VISINDYNRESGESKKSLILIMVYGVLFFLHEQNGLRILQLILPGDYYAIIVLIEDGKEKDT